MTKPEPYEMPFSKQELEGRTIYIRVNAVDSNRGPVEYAGKGTIHIATRRDSGLGVLEVDSGQLGSGLGPRSGRLTWLTAREMQFLQRAPEGSDVEFFCHDPAVAVSLPAGAETGTA